MEKVIFILGPTGCGKSKMALRLAQKFNGEIISADSVQVFKGFDIGSAKITEKEMGNIPHYCIDICEPTDYFTVSDFVELTKQKIHELNDRGVLPIVVGGTGLYVNSLVNGFNFGGTSKNNDFRAEMEALLQKEGEQVLYERLKKLNPMLASKTDYRNSKRLIRALEIATFGQEQTKSKTEFDFKIFALTLERELLYNRINNRVDEMKKSGLVDEVKSLLKLYPDDCQPMRAIGYKEVVGFLKGEYDENTMDELIKQHSRNYAKRQMTYLRGLERSQEVCYIDVIDFDQAETNMTKIIKEWL